MNEIPSSSAPRQLDQHPSNGGDGATVRAVLRMGRLLVHSDTDDEERLAVVMGRRRVSVPVGAVTVFAVEPDGRTFINTFAADELGIAFVRDVHPIGNFMQREGIRGFLHVRRSYERFEHLVGPWMRLTELNGIVAEDGDRFFIVRSDRVRAGRLFFLPAMGVLAHPGPPRFQPPRIVLDIVQPLRDNNDAVSSGAEGDESSSVSS